MSRRTTVVTLPAVKVYAVRDASRIANEWDRLDPLSLAFPSLSPPNALVRSIPAGIEDHREWRPDRTAGRTYRLYSSRPARRSLRVGGPFFRFSSPAHTLVCVRRHRRREVLHALRRVGRGAGTRRVRRWSIGSHYRC